MGSFLFMGLIGIVIASLVNIFLGSSALQFAISVIGVAGVHRPHRLGHAADEGGVSTAATAAGGDIAAKGAIMGALSLYLNFINLFMMLLQLVRQPAQLSLRDRSIQSHPTAARLDRGGPRVHPRSRGRPIRAPPRRRCSPSR